MEIKDMTMQEVEARASELNDMILHDEVTDEEIESVRNEVEQLETRKAEIMQEVENRKAQLEEVNRTAVVVDTIEKEEVRKTMTLEEIRKSHEYNVAYANYLKTGKDEEVRALLTENVSGGNIPVPEYVEQKIRTAWENDAIMRYVGKSYVKGNLKVGFEISGTDAVFHTEGAAAVSEETLQHGIVELIAKNCKKWISVSDEALALDGEFLLDYVYDELAYRIVKKEADELLAKIKACGTASTNTPTTNVAVAQLQDDPAIDTVAKAISLLSDEAQNPIIVMNKATWGAFKSAQYAASYPVDPFEGLTVAFNNSLPAITAATTGVTYAIVGDFGQGALANFPEGEDIIFKFDDLTLAAQDLVKITGRQYVALGVVAPNAFVQLKKEA